MPRHAIRHVGYLGCLRLGEVRVLLALALNQLELSSIACFYSSRILQAGLAYNTEKDGRVVSSA